MSTATDTRRVVFDTSAVRAAKVADVKQWAAETPLYVSPHTLWELFTHLHEPNFAKWQAHIAKALMANVMDDAFFRLWSIVDPRRTNVGRALERTMPLRIARRVMNAKDYAEVERSYVIDPSTKRRHSLTGLSPSAELAESAVAEEYLRVFRSSSLVNLSTEEKTLLKSDDQFAKIIVDDAFRILRAGNERHLARIAIPLGVSLDFVFRGGKEIEINDGIDFCISAHLDLEDPFIFVTNDKRLHDSVSRALNLAERTVLVEKARKSTVLSLDGFRALVSRPPKG